MPAQRGSLVAKLRDTGVRVTLDLNPDAIERAKRTLAGAIKLVAQHRVMIGLQEDDGGQLKADYYFRLGVATLAEVMILHEYGTDDLPERSFLRAWFDANRDRLLDGMTAAMRAEYQGDKEAVRTWAATTAAEWRAWIADGGDFVGLRQRTIDEKQQAGLSEPETPLVATKQFVDSWRAKLDGEKL